MSPAGKGVRDVAAYQDALLESWSDTFNVAANGVLRVAFFFALAGVCLQLIEAVVRSLGAFYSGGDFPNWARLDIADYAIGWTVGGIIVGLLLLIVTRPRNAAITTIMIGGGLLASAVGGTMLFASAPEHLELDLNMFGADVATVDLTAVKRSIAERMADHRMHPAVVALIDLLPAIVALAAGALLFWLLTRLVPTIVGSSNRR